MTTAKAPSNMAIWDAVCKTDPANAKKVDQRGGFTAICAQSQRKAATALWGPYGSTWGMKDLSWDFLRETSNTMPVELYLCATFYYPGGEFEVASDIKYRAGDDCHKKVLTDATTKALSMLGFNSDVFEGKFEDNKYVAERKAEVAGTANDAGATYVEIGKPVVAKPPNTNDIVSWMNRVVAPLRQGEFALDLRQFTRMAIATTLRHTVETWVDLETVKQALMANQINLATGEAVTKEAADGVVQ